MRRHKKHFAGNGQYDFQRNPEENEKIKAMKNNDLLDEVLKVLRGCKDNREQLEKLHHYMLNELYAAEDAVSEAIIIPERYVSLIKDTADSLSGRDSLLY
ncbi:hypothetical protein [Agriterribacter sp.]|uniref:hypothetical protein n=1 Tax=Agriterribacter sp. TaxID=2821509 RepID=UPI002B540D77|nr:hypothetical protein [Agriterribacter sp.]HTN08536.1 hypothetical protein [Agriterribacter sp.]